MTLVIWVKNAECFARQRLHSSFPQLHCYSLAYSIVQQKSRGTYLIQPRYEIIYEHCSLYMFSTFSESSRHSQLRWTCKGAFRFPLMSVFIVSWASSVSWWLHAFCQLYTGIEFWPQWYAAFRGKWINGFTAAIATLIYLVSATTWWDMRAYSQVIQILFLSAAFDSSQYIFAAYGLDPWAWQQQVTNKGGIVIWYSSLSWIQLCKRHPGLRVKIVDSKSEFSEMEVFVPVLGGGIQMSSSFL